MKTSSVAGPSTFSIAMVVPKRAGTWRKRCSLSLQVRLAYHEEIIQVMYEVWDIVVGLHDPL